MAEERSSSRSVPPFAHGRPGAGREAARRGLLGDDAPVATGDGLPGDLAGRLADPQSWVRGDDPYDASATGTHLLLSTMWHAVRGCLPQGVPASALRLVLVRSAYMSMHVRDEPDGSFSIVLSDALVRAVDAYAKAWVCFHHPEHVAAEPTSIRAAARDRVLTMAWSHRHRGTAVTGPDPGFTDAGLALAAAHAGAGLMFLLVHEAAHIRAGHVGSRCRAPLDPVQCLTVRDLHDREHAADAYAAAWLRDNPLAVTDTAASIRLLFELLELLELGASGAQRTHPLGMRRLLDVLSVVDPRAQAALLRDLRLGAAGFWLLRPE